MTRTSAPAVMWLLLAQLAAIAPLAPTIPIWMVLVWGAVAWWYWRIVTAAWSFPSALVKVALVVFSVAGIYLQYRQWLALEPMVATLVLAVILKVLELKQRRDHWLVLLLCYFVVACRFLFEQQINAVPVAVLQLLAILAAQQMLYREKPAIAASVRLSALMLIQALPLMLFLFLVFPRIGPLWSMPLPSAKAQTGMSDELRFGDIAELSQNAALAFRVRFEGGQLPPPSQRYWRGLVLENYDSQRWTVNRMGRLTTPPPPPLQGERQRYVVTLEPGAHEWLYSLPVARVNRDDIRYAGAYQWLPKAPLTGRLQYVVDSVLTQPRTEASNRVLQRNLRLPGNDSPRARELALQWARQYPDPADRVAAALRYFRNSPFEYTLKPALLGRDNVDEFLFESRQGFCEHYAGSFVFLMRAAGVPSRLVVGYQGGEVNTTDNYLLVHQSDAHAWAEVWLPARGWQRIDPTSTVAPDRVALGADSLLSAQQGFLGKSPLSLRRFDWARDIRLYLDSVNYAWANWVLNYDSERQSGVLSSLMGGISVKRMLVGLLIFGALPMALVALMMFKPAWRASRREPALRYYHTACRRLARRTGLRREPGETVAAFSRRVGEQAPEWAPWFAAFSSAFERCQYRRDSDALSQLRALKRPKKLSEKEIANA
ncbi:transglutaminase TgpA family protein [Spongiibacter marinus]|uniref:transglutaminase TgpA family protein n=1 Tax=Spongiibacter marinus TaxID=354246 RepID=UPI003567A942